MSLDKISNESHKTLESVFLLFNIYLAIKTNIYSVINKSICTSYCQDIFQYKKSDFTR